MGVLALILPSAPWLLLWPRSAPQTLFSSLVFLQQVQECSTCPLPKQIKEKKPKQPENKRKAHWDIRVCVHRRSLTRTSAHRSEHGMKGWHCRCRPWMTRGGAGGSSDGAGFPATSAARWEEGGWGNCCQSDNCLAVLPVACAVSAGCRWACVGAPGAMLPSLSGGRQARGFLEDTDTRHQFLVSTFLVPVWNCLCGWIYHSRKVDALFLCYVILSVITYLWVAPQQLMSFLAASYCILFASKQTNKRRAAGGRSRREGRRGKNTAMRKEVYVLRSCRARTHPSSLWAADHTTEQPPTALDLFFLPCVLMAVPWGCVCTGSCHS